MMNELKLFFAHPWQYLIGKTILFFFYYLCRGNVFDEETIAAHKDQGFIITANHVSYLDGLIIDAYLRHKHNIEAIFLVKEKLFTHWFWSRIVKGFNPVMISNDGGKIVLLDDFQRLKESRYIALFPEGTRSRTGELGSFKQGAVKFAQRFDLPILPVALHGFYETWPPTAKLPRPKKCTIVIGSPHTVERGEDLQESAGQLRLKIQEMLFA